MACTVLWPGVRVAREALGSQVGQVDQLAGQVAGVGDDPLALSPDPVGVEVELMQALFGQRGYVGRVAPGSLALLGRLTLGLGHDFAGRVVGLFEYGRNLVADTLERALHSRVRRLLTHLKLTYLALERCHVGVDLGAVITTPHELEQILATAYQLFTHRVKPNRSGDGMRFSLQMSLTGRLTARGWPIQSDYPMTPRDPLTDGHGRLIADLRVSVTDRCNFRCQYCMPAEGLPWLERKEVLSFEEITRLVALFASLGVHDLRLTGGEPLVRRDFPQLLEMLAAVEGLAEVATTTNGFLLERDAAALIAAGQRAGGARLRFNVSVDSLQRDRFYALTRRDALERVLRGLAALAEFPQAHPIKVNAVALRDFTEEEVPAFVELARNYPYEVRFIEFMPLDADRAWSSERVLSGAELHALIDALHPLEPLAREPSATARVYRFKDGRGRIGLISPVTEPFCGDCNRVRLTADGRLRTCLFSLNETDLRGPLRAGADDSELEAVIRDAVWRKELKHHIGEPGFIQPARTMSAIGG